MRFLIAASVLLTAASLLPGRAHAQLPWPEAPKKAPLRFRVVAVALADPRSSYFASHEVLIAETEIAHDEWSLIKIVYNFLPYQPRLSESGFDYALVYVFSTTRDPNCDESIEQMTQTSNGPISLRYAHDSPFQDLQGRRTKPLPCYVAAADDFIRSDKLPQPPATQ